MGKRSKANCLLTQKQQSMREEIPLGMKNGSGGTAVRRGGRTAISRVQGSHLCSKYLGGFKGSLGYRDPISNKNTNKIPTGGWVPVNLAEIHAAFLTQQV